MLLSLGPSKDPYGGPTFLGGRPAPAFYRTFLLGSNPLMFYVDFVRIRAPVPFSYLFQKSVLIPPFEEKPAMSPPVC